MRHCRIESTGKNQNVRTGRAVRATACERWTTLETILVTCISNKTSCGLNAFAHTLDSNRCMKAHCAYGVAFRVHPRALCVMCWTCAQCAANRTRSMVGDDVRPFSFHCVQYFRRFIRRRCIKGGVVAQCVVCALDVFGYKYPGIVYPNHIHKTNLLRGAHIQRERILTEERSTKTNINIFTERWMC